MAGVRFTPRRRASPWRRGAVVLVGPLMWVVALVVLAFVADHGDAVELAAIVLAGSFVLGIVLIGGARLAQDRQDRRR